uniref:mitochondrial peptide methionine sulfoxide reductase isoform X2 n=1 Tax=Monopterus albus TaxID=43700 RepID=UPI0009B3C72D|nr:mitochondrial peptide methionine sulfoxide reductase-like isoform X2 [Monopterus albus]
MQRTRCPRTMNIHINGVFAAVSSPLPLSRPRLINVMESSQKTQLLSQLFSQTQINGYVFLLFLAFVSLDAAEPMACNAQLPSRDRALKGRKEKMVVADKHAVNGNPTVEPFPEGMETIMFGMGCFWGAERLFWQIPGVFSTQVGFAGGFTANPTYQEVRTGLTGHTEVVRVVFSPKDISLEELLKHFWESHDPTQEFLFCWTPWISKHATCISLHSI